MKLETKLAKVFQHVETIGAQADNIAAGILRIVHEGKIRSVEDFDPLVKAAYEANGWNPRQGRPSAEDKEQGRDTVPPTVRTYVTQVRSAMREGVNVLKCDTFYDLRQALRKKRNIRLAPKGGNGEEAAVVPDAVKNDFEGVLIRSSGEPNGALFHDLGLTFMKLPEEHRDVFGRQLNRLLHKYMPLIKASGRRAKQQAA